jgi:hypothetical protein
MAKTKMSLAETHPEVAKQWHPTKNDDLTPSDVTYGSDKIIWWKCSKGNDHEWEARIANRTTLKRGCPICGGKKIVTSNSLFTTHSKLLKIWHYQKNKDLDPKEISKGSNKKVWWKCPKGNNHEWEAPPYRVNENSCPYCNGKKISLEMSLFALYPKIAAEWHHSNKISSKEVFPNSHKKVWWKCAKGEDHEWRASISTRTKGNNCPVCAGYRVVNSNCLATLNPEIAIEWHDERNGNLTPYDVIPGSNKKVWWKCPKGEDHIYKSSIENRTRLNRGCPICSGIKIVDSNCLNKLAPSLANEWDYKQNYPLTPNEVGIGSPKSFWWICSKDSKHKWRTSIHNRAKKNGTGCPYCDLTPQSKQELTITFELMKFFKNIDPKGFKTRLDGRLRAIDIYIPKLNLCVEFDGAYWHKDKRDIDKIKSEMLLDEGFELIRVREEPLKKIYDSDVISKQPYNGKQVTNDILSVIISKFKLDKKLITEINEYQSKNELQNEKGLERYIDKILTEKATKK